MGVVDAGVDDADHGLAVAVERPRLGGVDVGVGRAAGLAGVVQPPQEAVIGIVGDVQGPHEVIGADVEHVGVGTVCVEGLVHVHAGIESDRVQSGDDRQLPAEVGALEGRGGIGSEADKDAARVPGIGIDLKAAGHAWLGSLFQGFQLPHVSGATRPPHRTAPSGSRGWIAVWPGLSEATWKVSFWSASP